MNMTNQPQLTPVLDSAPLSRLSEDEKAIDAKIQNGPIQVMKNASIFGVLVSVEQWNKIAAAMDQFEFLQEIIELQEMEIERLKNGEEDGGPWDIAELERIAGRVPA